MNFAWSFKPFFNLFRAIYGIDLDESVISKWGRYFLNFLCLFWFVCFNIPTSVFLLIEGFEKTSHTLRSKEMNDKLHYIAPAILIFSFHVSFLASVFRKWKPLWEKLLYIQNIIGNDRAFYRQLRRDAFMGMILIFMVNIFEQ